MKKRLLGAVALSAALLVILAGPELRYTLKIFLPHVLEEFQGLAGLLTILFQF